MNSNKMTVSVAKIVELLDLKSFNDIDLKSRKITCSDVNRPSGRSLRTKNCRVKWAALIVFRTLS